MKILVIGDVGGADYYHVGDEALFSVNIDWIKQQFPNYSILGVSADPAFSSKMNGVECIKEVSISKTQRDLFSVKQRIIAGLRSRAFRLFGNDSLLSRDSGLFRDVDLLHLVGGGNLTSLFPGEFYKRSWYALRCLSLGIPVVCSGQTLGPEFSKTDREMLLRWLPYVNYFGVRDRSSSILAQDLCVPEGRIGLAIDDAFFLEDSSVDRASLNNSIGPKTKALRIGLSLHRRAGSDYSQSSLVSLFANLLNRIGRKFDAEFLFLPHISSAETSKYDCAFAEEISKEMDEPGRILIPREFFNDRQTLCMTGFCDLYLSTRYHGSVFALAKGVPAIGFGQDKHSAVKFEGLCEQVPECFSVLDPKDPELLPKIAKVMENLEAIRAAILKAHPRLRSGYLEQRKRIINSYQAASA